LPARRLLASLLLLSPALGGDVVTLERKLVTGARARVQERWRAEVQSLYRGKGAAVGDSEVTEVVRRYLEEVRTAQPEGLWREFELSTRAKAKRGAPLPEGERTSLHGRAVLVSGLEVKPDGPFELSQEDGEALRFDRLAAALLPPGKQAERGKEWTTPAAAIGRALFGELVPEANLQGSGARVELKAVRKEGKREVAQLRVKALLLRMARSDSLPGLELSLKGELSWDLEAGRLAAGALEGSLVYTVSDAKEDAQAQAQGSVSWSLQAEPLEARPVASDDARARGDPPPPGTQGMVCRKDAAHVYGVPELRCCILCGKELNSDRVCAEHGWSLRFCPRDGAPLDPR
jgi:hypothetical protein